MRNRIISVIVLSVFVWTFCIPIPYVRCVYELPEFIDTETTISMDLQDASLKDILKIFLTIIFF